MNVKNIIKKTRHVNSDIINNINLFSKITSRKDIGYLAKYPILNNLIL